MIYEPNVRVFTAAYQRVRRQWVLGMTTSTGVADEQQMHAPLASTPTAAARVVIPRQGNRGVDFEQVVQAPSVHAEAIETERKFIQSHSGGSHILAISYTVANARGAALLANSTANGYPQDRLEKKELGDSPDLDDLSAESLPLPLMVLQQEKFRDLHGTEHSSQHDCLVGKKTEEGPADPAHTRFSLVRCRGAG